MLTLNLKKYSLPTHIQNFYMDEENSHEIKEALEKGYSIVTSDVYKYNGDNLQTNLVTELEDELYSVKKANDNLQNKLTERDNDNAKIIDNIVNKRLEDKEKINKVLEDNLNDKKNQLKQEKEDTANAIRERDATKNELNKLQITLSNSAKKGKYGEDMIREILENNEQFNELFYLNNEGKTAYSCDFHIIPRKYGNTQYAPRFLLEVKFYNESNSNKLVQNEIPKMKRDIEGFIKRKIPIIASLFISIGCEIPTKEGISFETYNDTNIVYISNFREHSSPDILLLNTLSVFSYIYELNKNKSTDNSLYFIKGLVSRFINVYNRRFLTRDYFEKPKKALEEAEKRYNSDTNTIIKEFNSVIKDYDSNINVELENDIENILKIENPGDLTINNLSFLRGSYIGLKTSEKLCRIRCNELEEKEKVVEKIENSVMLKVENPQEEIVEEENIQEEVLEDALQCEYCQKICKSKGGLTFHYKKCKNKNAENTSTEN